jgi:hypothetical protein
MAATGVILTALTLIGTVITSGIAQTGVARQRQSADGLANQTLEQIRALPFSKVQAGLKSTDTSGDSNITSSGCPTAPCFGVERLVTSAGLANVEPLVPHVKTTAVGPTTYTVSSYVTYFENSTTTNTYRATVYVTWTSKLRGGRISTVQAQTLIFSPSACLSTTTHPFSGPCNPSFSSAAVADSASVNVTGTIAGVELDHLQLLGGRVTSDLLVEQIARAEGLTQAPGATIQALGSDELVVGRQTATSRADNDPGTSVQQSYATSNMSASAQSQSVGALTVSSTAGGSGKTTSTTSATTAANLCPNLTPTYTNENDSQSCSASSTTSDATITAEALLDALGSTTLATLSPQAVPIVGITDVNKGPGSGTPGAGTCPTTPTTGDGCTRAYLSRAAADIGVAGLGLLGPAGFTQYVKVLGMTDLVKSEAGPGTNPPSATVTAGSIEYWDGVGYSSASIGTLAADVAIPTLSIHDSGTEVTLSGSIHPPAKSTTSTSVTTATNPTCLTPPGVCQTSSTAKSSGPTIDVSMLVKVAGETIADLQFSVYTGTIQSKATYTPTPAG